MLSPPLPMLLTSLLPLSDNHGKPKCPNALTLAFEAIYFHQSFQEDLLLIHTYIFTILLTLS